MSKLHFRVWQIKTIDEAEQKYPQLAPDCKPMNYKRLHLIKGMNTDLLTKLLTGKANELDTRSTLADLALMQTVKMRHRVIMFGTERAYASLSQ